MGNLLSYKRSAMKKLTILLSTVLIFACKEKEVSNKFLGEWISVDDSSQHCRISKTGKNFVFEHYIYPDTQSVRRAPAFYDKLKDKLIIKLGTKDIDAIYDEVSKRMIFEQIGAYKKTQ